jgi:molybdenum cofactor biosynthesis protein MoaC
MIDVSDKPHSLRSARAEAVIRATTEICNAVRDDRVPKGDALEISRVAGILASKRTSDLIPLCHPIPIDVISIDFEVSADQIVIRSEAKAIWKTGIEMEALTAVTVAALNLYDMLKPFGQPISIESVRLLEKRGGRSDFRDSFDEPLKAGILVVSDRCSSGECEDKSGVLAKELLERHPLKCNVYEILPDDIDLIAERLTELCDDEKLDVIITTGGTGIGPKDVTVDATDKIIDQTTPGIAHALLSYGLDRNRLAMFSRQIAGIRGKTLIINLPGSPGGVRDGIYSLFPHVLHFFPMVRGKGHE